MKTSILLLATLGLTFASVTAQTVPEFLNYQGTVTDSSGIGLGDTAPVNRKVLFRIHSAATAGALVWTEEQTVTISKGEFSVLLGQGIQFASEPHASLLSIFGEGATDRYVSVTVDNGDGTLNGSDLAIAPRQRITSTAYSFRAGTADSIASGSSLKLNTADSGLGYYDAGRTFGGFNISGPVLYGAGGGALGAKIGAAETSALRWDSAGNVGIGTNSPLAGKKLHVVGDSYFNGKVGIMNSNPAYTLDVTGDGHFTSNIRVGGDAYITGDSDFTGHVQIGSTFPATNDTELQVVGGFTDLNGLLINGGTTHTIYQPTGGIGIMVNDSSESVNIGSITAGASFTVRSGRVGIGTGTSLPSHKLDVVGGYALLNGLRISGVDTGNTIYQATGNMGITTGSSTQSVNIGSHTAPVLTVKDGKVGIGTTSPSRAKLEITGYGWWNLTGTGNASSLFRSGLGAYAVGSSLDLSIYASNTVAANLYVAFSDERIKRIAGRSDAFRDLDTLLAIEVTDYTYIDTITQGNTPQKKVIAQQVEQVFPQAVSQITATIPDIYETAEFKEGWIQLKTNLVVGERVQIMAGKEQQICEVLEVGLSADRFRVAWEIEESSVFVYGREVDDFRSVDYDAIAMLNVSATQELARQLVPNSSDVASLKQENLQLKTRLAALEAKDAARDARLAAIEQLLSTK
jgi:hypothetical protein